MEGPGLHPLETRRVAALDALRLLDTAPEAVFDAAVELAAKICGVPVALVSLVDRDRQWFKANHGLEGVSETPRDISFCGHAILAQGLFEVSDALADPRFSDNPLVSDAPGIRFYAGQPLLDASDNPVGTLCVIDYQARHLSDDQRAALALLSRQLTAVLGDRARLGDATRTLAALDARHRSLVESAPVMIHAVDETGRIQEVNSHWERTTGYTREQVLGRHFTELLDEESARRVHGEVLPEFLRSGECREVPLRLCRADGETRELSLSAAGVRNEDGRLIRSFTISADMTERNRAERELRRQHERISVTLRSIGDAVITTDDTGRVDYLNPVAEHLTGWTQGEAHGRPAEEVFVLLDEGTRNSVRSPARECLLDGKVHNLSQHTLLVSRDGREFWVEDSAAPILDDDGHVFGVVLVFRDVTAQRQMHRELIRQAQEDPLTGLPNRREFELRIAHAVRAAQTRDAQHAVLYMDLDQFKLVNDTCGHGAGDQLLHQLGSLFSAQLRSRDTVARLGGDEFGVLLENCPRDEARRLAERLRESVHEFRYEHEGQRFQVGLSIGMSFINASSSSVTEVIKAADSALYAAKDAGRNRVQEFNEDDSELAHRHGEMRWVQRIQEALESNQFVLHAQPIVQLDGSDGAGRLEVLVRLQQGEEQLILPSGFMPAAERYQRAVSIDRWVVDNTLAQLARHRDALDGLELCSINLSGQSLGDRLFHAFILRKLEEHRIPAAKLCFEVTETAAIANLDEARRFMGTLSAYGCRFALDDFGSGLSSFGYLRELPVDMVKIDGLFVRDMAQDSVDLAMVRAINDVAHLMGKTTVAESVESAAIADEAARLGIDLAQGFGVGKPRALDSALQELGWRGRIETTRLRAGMG